MKFHVETQYGVEYKYNTIKGIQHIVFNNKADFERYFINRYNSVPNVYFSKRVLYKFRWWSIVDIDKNQKILVIDSV